MIERYYREELAYLRDLGREFGEMHPDCASLLGEQSSDPDVERLLEGVAFIGGRIRQRLDDDLPELTHTLLDLVYPHYLRPLPAATIVEFKPSAGGSIVRTIPRHTPLGTIPRDGTTCVFRTCYPVDLQPMVIEHVGLERTGDRSGRLRITLAAQPGAQLADLDLRTLRLYLAGEDETARTLLKLLLCDVRRLEVGFRCDDAAPEPDAWTALDTGALRPVGLAADLDGDATSATSLVPHPARSFCGYRLLQEYFFFPAKFHFVDLELGAAAPSGAPKGRGSFDRLDIRIIVDELPPRFGPMDAGRIRLHCTPAVNLFPRDAEPIVIDRQRSEYRVSPDHERPHHYEIFSVEEVHRVAPDRRRLPHLNAFDFIARSDQAGVVAFETVLRPGLGERPTTDTYLRFVIGSGASAPEDADALGALLPPGEMLSIDLLCTNRDLPDALGPGDVTRPVAGSPEHVPFVNVCAITPSVAPPLDGDLHWRLISHLSLNYASLSGVAPLRGLLGLYDFLAMRDDQARRRTRRRLEGIADVDTRVEDDLHRGAPVRVVHTRLALEEEKFAGAGDIFLFTLVLERFLSLSVAANSFSRLTTVTRRSGAAHTFPARAGTEVLL